MIANSSNFAEIDKYMTIDNNFDSFCSPYIAIKQIRVVI